MAASALKKAALATGRVDDVQGFVRGAIAALAPDAQIDGIRVEQQETGLVICIRTPRPGAIIGRRGQTIERLREALVRHTKDEHARINVLDSSKDAAERKVRCSFCGKWSYEVGRMVAGPGVAICDECIALCNDILIERHGEPAASDRVGWLGGSVDEDALRSASTEDLLAELERTSAIVKPVEAHVERNVALLRDRKVSWAKIGEALGLSRQGAWARYSNED